MLGEIGTFPLGQVYNFNNCPRREDILNQKSTYTGTQILYTTISFAISFRAQINLLFMKFKSELNLDRKYSKLRNETPVFERSL